MILSESLDNLEDMSPPYKSISIDITATSYFLALVINQSHIKLGSGLFLRAGSKFSGREITGRGVRVARLRKAILVVNLSSRGR
jgi:hypothetical protein